MSSHKESNDEIETPHVELSDGESVELLDELKDKNQASSVDGDSKAKRKNSSEVWAHFVEVDAMYKGKMVKKKQCIHCKHTYVVSTGGTTSSLKRHLTSCAYFKRSKGNTKGFINFDSSGSDNAVCYNMNFEKYWGEIGVLMSIASILDPRFKLVSVEWTFERLYPPNECDSRVEDVTRKLKTLFEKYLKSFVASKAALSKSAASTSFDNQVKQEDDFFAFLKSRPVETGQKTELEQSAKEEETLEVNIPTLNEC
ncbi:hypothetical protein E3N88_12732 [Mikania micrantha]|uniref:BED-type domain-containing protein n=1 Tax=Mikania micrantha TaxID=192012 RepID=A0A5N6P6S9_9ASTR|nr:hypothetical protein E3N88_12732 [Mikania micrantha]